jgi:hypothetical protein
MDENGKLSGEELVATLDKFEALKTEMPEQWGMIAAMQIEEAILEYNEVADGHEPMDVIVAFKCTKAERDEIVANLTAEAEEVLDDGTEGEDS